MELPDWLRQLMLYERFGPNLSSGDSSRPESFWNGDIYGGSQLRGLRMSESWPLAPHQPTPYSEREKEDFGSFVDYYKNVEQRGNNHTNYDNTIDPQSGPNITTLLDLLYGTGPNVTTPFGPTTMGPKVNIPYNVTNPVKSDERPEQTPRTRITTPPERVTGGPKNIVPPDQAPTQNVGPPLDALNRNPNKDHIINLIKLLGGSVNDTGIDINVYRMNDDNKIGLPTYRDSMFYGFDLDKIKNMYGRPDAGLETGMQLEGGNTLVGGPTRFVNPYFTRAGLTTGVAGNAVELVPNYRELSADLGDLMYDLDYSKWKKAPIQGGQESRPIEEGAIRRLIERYGGDPNAAGPIEFYANHSYGKTPIIENILANHARRAGHDAIIGYTSNGLGEVQDLRERHYPDRSGSAPLHPFYNPYPQQPYSETVNNILRMLGGQ